MRRFKPQMYSSHRQKIFIAILPLSTTKSAVIGEKDKSSQSVYSTLNSLMIVWIGEYEKVIRNQVIGSIMPLKKEKRREV